MAQIPVNFPDVLLPRLEEALTARHGYDPAGGQTKRQFVSSLLRRFLIQELSAFETEKAGRDALVAKAAALAEELNGLPE